MEEGKIVFKCDAKFKIKQENLHTVLLHGLEETDDNLGSGSDQDLTLSSSLSVHDSIKGIVQNTHAHHFCS